MGVCIVSLRKQGIRYLYTLTNEMNNNVLTPVGSECVKKFKRDELTEQIPVLESLYKLIRMAINGAFKSCEYNSYVGKNDYDFMLKMFNKRKNPTDKQQRKINAIIMNLIIPYAHRNKALTSK